MHPKSKFDELKSIWKNEFMLPPEGDIQNQIKDTLGHQQKYKNGMNTSALNVIDLVNDRYYYVDDEIEKILGYSKEEIINQSISFMFSKMPVRHRIGVINSTFHHNNYFKKLNAKDINDYITNRELIVKDKKGNKRKMLHQIVHNYLDVQHNIFAMAILFTDISHIKKDESFNYYIYHKKDNEVVYSKGKEVDNPFTQRELELLKYISQGLSSQEIADHLYLSIHTVKTHRKNILKKTGLNNMIAVIKKYIN